MKIYGIWIEFESLLKWWRVASVLDISDTLHRKLHFFSFKKVEVISQVVVSWHFRQKKGCTDLAARARGVADCSSMCVSVWQGPATSVLVWRYKTLPRLRWGRKTKKMVLKPLRHARQAAGEHSAAASSHDTVASSVCSVLTTKQLAGNFCCGLGMQ